MLLTTILSVINIINFTMAADDADRITQTLANEHGMFNENNEFRKGNLDFSNREKMGQMGPDSPDMRHSVRFFTVRFSKNGTAEEVAHNINAFSEQEAIELARGLKKETTGWTNTTYRYRVYKSGDYTYVTVIDQSRELLPSYRILIISLIGIVAGMIISFVFLLFVGKKLFDPLEEADRKQKNFIRDAENEFKVPLTVISANTEVIEKEHGSNEFTKSTHRQVKKMTELVKRLGTFGIFEGDRIEIKCNLTDILNSKIDAAAQEFVSKGIRVNREISDGIYINADRDEMEFIIDEFIQNGMKFADSYASFYLGAQKDRVYIKAVNDTSLPNGNADQIFDRFTRLVNAENIAGNGLGLSKVKEIVQKNNGRISAAVSNNEMTITVLF